MNAPATNLPAERKPSYQAVEMDRAGGGGMLMPKSLGEVVAFASVMSRADLALPKHLRGNDGACMAVAMQALRWEMDPFAVANKSYSVNDRLAYEAQLIAAVVHTRAPIKGRPKYTHTGEGPSRQCQVTCVMADGEEREYTSPRFDQITTKNSPLWKSDPDQQLGYFAIRSWARRHTPEVILGVYTPEEVETIRDVTPGRPGTGMRARLEARAVSEADEHGFDPDHVAAEIAPADAEFTENHEADGSSEGERAEANSTASPPEQSSAELSTASGEAGSSTVEGLAPPHSTADAGTLADRINGFKGRVRGASTTVKLQSFWNASVALRNDIDKADPDEFGTSADLEEFWQARYDVVEAEERGARG